MDEQHPGPETALVVGNRMGEAFLEIAVLAFIVGVIFAWVMSRQLKDERRLSYQRFIAQIAAVLPGVVLCLGFPVIIVPTVLNLVSGGAIPAVVFHVRGIPYWVGYLLTDVMGLSYSWGMGLAGLTFLLLMVVVAVPLGMRIYPRLMPRDTLGAA
ncbi:MAG: hypothetical protein ACFCGT_16155 [Sandaracinaceae bacterium]